MARSRLAVRVLLGGELFQQCLQGSLAAGTDAFDGQPVGLVGERNAPQSPFGVAGRGL